ncbi:MAG: PhnD/SsuA/transferrin family substrate-binding protein [Pseudomonadota bacterium]
MIGIVALFTVQAKADWRSDIGIFRIGVFTGSQSSSALAKSEPFRIAMAEALGMEVEFFAARTTGALIDALRTDRIEYGLLSASAYALSWHLCECVEPIAAPRSIDSTDGYHAIMITRQDGPDEIKELAGKQVAELSPGSVTQSVYVKQQLKKRGLALDSVEFIANGSGEETLSAFLGGSYDALIGWSSMTGFSDEGYSRGTLRQIASSQNLTGFRIIWQSAQLPHRPHVVRKKLPGEVKQILRNTLSGLFDSNPVAYDSIEPVYGGGFGLVRHQRYSGLVDVIRELEPASVKQIDDDAENSQEITPQ